MYKRLFASILVPITFWAGAVLSAVAGESPDPSMFESRINNPWLPLTPGSVKTYRGTKDDKPATLVTTVSKKTKTVGGVDCVAVEELVSLAGKPSDRTISYYVQDKAGNVWTFGEDVSELNSKGKVVKVEGWHAGIDGATPVLVIEAVPAVGHTLVNEYTNDHSEVVSLAKPVKVPFGSYPDALVVKEWTPDEPDVLVNKYYVRGMGLVRDVSVKGDNEEFVLVAVKQ
jgi:hypothetical protein